MRTITSTLTCLVVLAVVRAADGQALPTAAQLADVQVGIDFSYAKPDYAQDLYNLAQPTNGENSWHGYGAYANIDFRERLGLALDFHQLSGPDAVLYERTFEVGARYLHPIGYSRFVPYVKGMAGRGIFNFAAIDSNAGQSVQIANLAYNTLSFGGGLDFRLRPGLNVRVLDYEYQRWSNFPPRSLNPQVLSVGIAYHFHGPMSLRK